MRTNDKIAGRYARTPRHARTFKPETIIKSRPFDPVAYAAALEVLG
jgi:hypothetical protein